MLVRKTVELAKQQTGKTLIIKTNETHCGKCSNKQTWNKEVHVFIFICMQHEKPSSSFCWNRDEIRKKLGNKYVSLSFEETKSLKRNFYFNLIHVQKDGTDPSEA